MKKSAVILSVLSACAWVSMAGIEPASATTVVVDEGNVTTVSGTRTAVVEPAGTKTVVVQKEAVALTAVKDPRILEGEVIRVDLPAYQMTVRDIDGRERKVLLKRGTINNYKVDDYVVVHLTPDLREAMDIETRHVADIEGDIVQVDRASGRIFIRGTDGSTRTVVARTDVIGGYKVGDYVRLYVVFDDPNFQEAKIIRVR